MTDADQPGEDFDEDGLGDEDYPPEGGRRKRRGRSIPGCLAALVALALIAGGAYYAVTRGAEFIRDQFSTAPDYPGPGRGKVIFEVHSGDTVGQGYGINPDVGGMTIYEAMRRMQPDFFVHSGDTIYADNPLLPEKKLPDGKVWKNIVTEAKSKVAETLDEYRGNYRYNLLDENLRRFNAEVPTLAQWDDHEVLDNWYWHYLARRDTGVLVHHPERARRLVDTSIPA